MLDELKGLEPATVGAADKKRVAEWIKDLGASAAAARAKAGLLLAQLPAIPDTAGAKIAAQIKKEKDDLVKASLLLALGEVSRTLGTRANTDLVDKSTGADAERSPRAPPIPVRVAAIVALARMNPLYLTASMIDFLRGHTSLAVDPATMPWNAGDLGGVAALVLPTVEVLNVDAALAEMRALISAHPPKQGPGIPWANEVSSPWFRFLGRVLAPLGDRVADEPLLSELSGDQRQVLTFGVQHNLTMSTARHGLDFQMPMDPTWPSWRQYLGLDPAGMMDRGLSIDQGGATLTLPIWKWFRKLTRGQIQPVPVAAALRAALSPAEIVDLAREATRMLYAVPKEDGLVPSPRSSLLREILPSSCADAPDLDGIRYVLDALHGGKGWDLRASGWKGGPFLPSR